MKNKLLKKLAAIAVLSLLLLLPLHLIEGKIAERHNLQSSVGQSIAEASAGQQTLIGPVLAIRYKVRQELTGQDAGYTGELTDQTMIIAPKTLSIAGKGKVERRSYGIYHAQLYNFALAMTGQFDIAANLGLDPHTRVSAVHAYLVVGLSDLRGVVNDPEFTVGGAARHFSAGTGNFLPGHGMHIDLGELNAGKDQSMAFSAPMTLMGTERLAIAPAGDTTTVNLETDWPHPSFQGRFLPASHSISDTGFKAQWQVSQLARNFDRVLQGEAGKGPMEALVVSFIEPVNVYLQAERAVKYGLLFVILTFAAFFLSELLRGWPIHPMQYLLVGAALAMFFLLLIALTEHIPFIAAYGISAAACVLLIAVYLAGVLQGWLRGAVFGAGLTALYGIVYGVLLSEDNALLMGSCLLFAALGVTMLTTRRLDWDKVAEELTGKRQAQPDLAG